DIGNVIRYGAPEDWIPVLGRRILKLHIKEYSKVRGFGVRLLEGDNKWPAIMRALDAAGYQGWGISEQPGDQSRDAAGLKDLSDGAGRGSGGGAAPVGPAPARGAGTSVKRPPGPAPPPQKDPDRGDADGSQKAAEQPRPAAATAGFVRSFADRFRLDRRRRGR